MERRSFQTIAAGVTLGLCLQAVATDAAVLCERKGKLRLRPDACKPKETVVQDLAALGAAIAASGAQAASSTTALDLVEREHRITCPGAPSLVFVAGSESGYHDGIEDCHDGCRTHDGNQAACENAFALGDDGASSCFFASGFCVACEGCGRPGQTCTNACRPVTATCPGDPSRTVALRSDDACKQVTSQTTCEKAFHQSRFGTVFSCYWRGDECRGCGPSEQHNGDCTDTCEAQPGTCADATRTIFDRCSNVSDQVECEKRWHLERRGLAAPASCWWDADGTQCRGCGLLQEVTGNCSNTCRATP